MHHGAVMDWRPASTLSVGPILRFDLDTTSLNNIKCAFSVRSSRPARVDSNAHARAAILGEWLVILMNVSSPIAFRFRRYIGRQQQALSQRFSILRPPLFPRPYLLRAGCG